MAKSGERSGSWLMTYADFITLMMIFFIVLYTLTPGVEQTKWEAIVGVFQGSRSVLEHNAPVPVEREIVSEQELQRAANWEILEQLTSDVQLQESVELHMIPEGVQIILGEAALFESFSVNLLPGAAEILQEVVRGIDNYDYERVNRIDVQGHTDDRPILSGGFRKYENNWELGAGRALTVMDFLKEHARLSPEHYSISSFGEYRPLVPNTSAENMSRNRRVEILIRYHENEAEGTATAMRSDDHE